MFPAESFRSIKYQPRSMSERIVHKLTPKPSAPKPIGLRDPYPELERAYVAQVCLTWEALNWNYTSFRRHNGSDGNIAARCCPARVAQEFQQFQVLLHRFIENEPYEYGRRPEVYARMKNSTPKLLLVPEFRGWFGLLCSCSLIICSHLRLLYILLAYSLIDRCACMQTRMTRRMI